MKKFIKHIAVISAIFLALGTFAACSDGGDDNPPAPTTTKVTNLKVAPLADHSGATEVTTGLYTSYDYSAYYNNSDASKIYVTINAKDLAAHTNADKTAAYWVGLAIPGKDVKARTYWNGTEDGSKGNFDAGASWQKGTTDYTSFYFGSLDGSFKKDGKALKGIIEVGADAENITKTYEITFDVTTNKPFAIGYIKGSGNATDYKLVDSDYPDGKKTSDAHTGDWINDTFWIKFSDVTSISGKYVWMKFVGSDNKAAAIDCGKDFVKAGKYYAGSFLNKGQWDYMADSMKANNTGNANDNKGGDYEGDYTVYVYAFGTNPTNLNSSTFADFGKDGTLIGISKITVEKSDATKAAENAEEGGE